MSKRRPPTDFSSLMSGPNLAVLTSAAPIEQEEPVVETNDSEPITADESPSIRKEEPTPEPTPPPKHGLDDMGTFLEQLKTPVVYRAKGYVSHMCSTGADDAIKYITNALSDCGLPKPVQDRYLWNLGLMLLDYGVRKLNQDELSSIAAVASSNSEDLVLHKLFVALMNKMDR